MLRNFTSIPPFTDLGFDALAQVISLDGKWNLENLTEDSFMSRQGRPLSVLFLFNVFGYLQRCGRLGTRNFEGEDSIRKEIIGFAAEKLLNAAFTPNKLSNDQALACLSQRIPIEFNSTNYSSKRKEAGRTPHASVPRTRHYLRKHSDNILLGTAAL
jgi:hypothetical protein